MNEPVILRSAEFNPKVKVYWLYLGAVIAVSTVIGVLFLPFWFLIWNAIAQRCLDALECTLTDRSLKLKKGVLNRVEKTVPLDKITDVGLVQGPIMRALDLEALSVETAGQSAVGSLVNITGIKDTRAFRDAILKQRDLFVQQAGAGPVAPPTAALIETPPSPSAAGSRSDASLAVLVDIRDTLKRLEERLGTDPKAGPDPDESPGPARAR